jgi:HEAT repeat protein
MKRWLPLLVVAVLALTAAWYAFTSKRPPPRLEPTLAPYVFGNALPAVHPPDSALKPDVLSDPVQRLLSRVEWGTPEVFQWTQRHLPDDPDERAALARGLVRRYDQVVRGSPLLASRLLTAIGLVGDPVGLDTLVRATATPPDYLRVAAIRALAGFPMTEELSTLYTRLTGSAEEEVKRAALNEYLKRGVLGDPTLIRDFLENSEGNMAVPWLQQVAAHKLCDLADSCARHLASPHERVRQTAILALLVCADERGVAAAREELHATDGRRVVVGLSLYRDAQRLPPLDEARTLSGHASAEVRRYVAQALGAPCSGADEEAASGLLRGLTGDRDPSVAREAIHDLWKHGHQEAAAGWRESMRHGHGGELKEAASLLCETLLDEEAAAIARARLDGERLDGNDQANLLYGLRFFAQAADAPRFIARIERAGGREDLHVGDLGWLSESASVYVQSIGAGALRPTSDALGRAAVPRAQVVLIDTVRGLVKGAAPEDVAKAAERMFALVVDRAAAPEVRVAALESIPYFDTPKFGERLFALREGIGDVELARRITTLYAAFY